MGCLDSPFTVWVIDESSLHVKENKQQEIIWLFSSCDATDHTCLVVSPISLQESSKAKLLPHAQVPCGPHAFSRVDRDFNYHRALWIFSCGLQPETYVTDADEGVCCRVQFKEEIEREACFSVAAR